MDGRKIDPGDKIDLMATLEDIVNFVPRADGLATAGQPEPYHFPLIAEAGFEVVVNLVPADNPDALLNEAELVEEAGMQYVHLPVLWDKPSLKDMDAFFDLIDRLRGRRLFVHCMLNYRVSAFFYLYDYLVQGKPQSEARKVMDTIWDPDEYPVWSALIQAAITRGKPPASA